MSSPDPRASSHEDASMHHFMEASLAEQLSQLPKWSLPQPGHSPAGLLILMSACFGRCFFCAHVGVTDPPPEMITSWERIEKYLTGYHGSGVEDLCLAGTEPSTHPRFRHTLALARAAGVKRVQLMSSGVTLDRYAKRMRKEGIHSVCVPLYSKDATVHDGIVQVRGHHARVLAGLDAAIEAGIKPYIHTLAMRRTVTAIAPLASFVQTRWGVPLHIAPLRPKDDLFNLDEECMDSAQLAEAIGDSQPHLIGFPSCVLPQLSRDAPLVMNLYFRGQEAHYPPACGGCAVRAGCPGVASGWTWDVVPF